MEAAGRDYRYMMVFEKKEFQNDGAYTLDECAEVIKKVVANCKLSAASESVLRFLLLGDFENAQIIFY